MYHELEWCHTVVAALWYDDQAKLNKDGNVEWFFNLGCVINIYCFFLLKFEIQTYLL